jgi:lysophospholipase L1-like esterase
MKDSKNRRGLIMTLVLSLVANVILLVGIYVIGQKSHFFRKMEIRLGWKEQLPKDRGDYWCILGWTNTLKKLNFDADVVFFGNSITCGSNFQDYFSNIRICNLGYSGDNMDGMMLRIGQIKAVTPEKVFVMAGINGLQNQTEEVFENKYQRMVDSIKSSVPEAVVYLQSILPVNHSMKKGVASAAKIRKANEIIAKIAARSNCVYVNLWSLYEKDGEMPKELTRDGVHLFPEAYDRWADEIKKYIE